MTETVVHAQLIHDLKEYAALHGLTETRLGILFLRDPNLIRDLRNGRELRRSTEARIAELMRSAPKIVAPQETDCPHAEGKST